MKVIATTLAVVMSSILTTIVFGVEMTFGFVGGSAIVMLGKFNHSLSVAHYLTTKPHR